MSKRNKQRCFDFPATGDPAKVESNREKINKAKAPTLKSLLDEAFAKAKGKS